VQSAAAALEGPSRDALAALCQAYWPPVYAFIRKRGYDTEEARDLTQGFFALLLEKNYLTAADRQRGRFRSFLLTAVKHFLSNELDRAHALKRGGGQAPVRIDLDADSWHPPSATETVTPENLFERRWALSLLEHVMKKLRSEFAASGKEAEFDRLLPFLNKSEHPGYDSVAAGMGVSAASLRMAVHRMRRRYRELMRSEIAETVSSLEEIDDEIRFLMSVLST
jgi:RNA polymerase sigma-70 factor (ECF subfamily)